jgi:hypothetical protein
VNLFVVAWSERPFDLAAPDLQRLPFFPGREVQTWSSGRGAAAWVAHSDEYAEVSDDRLVLWSGHPEGRFARVSWDRRSQTFQFESDPMGSYPLYSASRDGVTWISNNPSLLRAGHAVRPEVVASLVGGGWSLSGDPMWEGVRRIDSGLAASEVVPMLGAGLDVDAAASDLVEVTGRLADWPGRPNVVPVTAGRDSRLVLAAALRAGVEFSATTGGAAGEADVDVGRSLASIAAVAHSLIPDDPHGSLFSHWRRAAELLTMTAGGTASLSDAVGFPLGPRSGPLPLWHSGQGGEIARGYYSARVRGESAGELADSLYSAFVMRRPHRAELLSQEGEQVVRGEISAFVGDVNDAGAAAEDVADLFYLLQRMGRWAGPTHGAVEYVRDTTSPLWHRRMLPHLLGLSARERTHEEFHLRLLDRLAPELAAAPGWPRRRSELARRVAQRRAFLGKVRRELRRRAQAQLARRPGGGAAAGGAEPSGADPFAAVLHEIRDVVLSQPSHTAWDVLDRARVESVLTRDAAALDEVTRYYVWRLATVFAATDHP